MEFQKRAGIGNIDNQKSGQSHLRFMGLLFLMPLGLVSGVSCGGEPVKSQASIQSPATWSGSMRELQNSLQRLSPYIYNENQYLSSQNDNLLKSELKTIAANSKSLNHNPTMSHRDPAIRFMASQFAEDLNRASVSFNEGKKSFSRYQMMKVGSYCVECHTSTAAGVELKSSTNMSFFKDLNTRDKAEYLIANRDFAGALSLLEGSFKANKSLDNFTLDRQVRLMLLITVRHQNSFEKTQDIVEMLKKTEKLPLFLKSTIPSMEKSLSVWKMQIKNSDVNLKLAQKIFSQGSSEIDTLRTLVLVHQMFSKGLKGEEESGALFLAGQAYEQLNEISPFEMHESYYKACIYQSPGTSIAKKCYQSLEDAIVNAYTGSSGTHLPVDVDIMLKELRSKAGR